jgi:hypothetical protein
MIATSNSPAALGLSALSGLPYGLLVQLASGWRPVSIYTRMVQWGLRALAYIMIPYACAAGFAALAPPDRPKLAAGCATALIAGALVGRRAFRRRREPRKRVLRRWLRPLDYLYGVAVYVLLAAGTAEAALESRAAAGGPSVMAGLFVISQLNAQFLFRLFSRAVEQDYAASRNWHHVLVMVPLLGGVVVDLALGASPFGPLFSVLLLAASWRFTDQRPANTIRTLLFLHARARTARAPA